MPPTKLGVGSFFGTPRLAISIVGLGPSNGFPQRHSGSASTGAEEAAVRYGKRASSRENANHSKTSDPHDPNRRSQIQRCLGRRHRSSKHNQYGLFSAKTQFTQEKMGGTFPSRARMSRALSSPLVLRDTMPFGPLIVCPTFGTRIVGAVSWS